MADHFDLATSALVTANTLKATLDDEYAVRRKTPEVLTRITRLREDLRHTLSMAKLHTNMAEVQAMHDLRAEVERLFQTLTAEPDAPMPRGQILALPGRES